MITESMVLLDGSEKVLQDIYAYQMRYTFPYRFPVGFAEWKQSFLRDIDGAGRILFDELYVRAAYVQNRLVGFVQYGSTAFGFDAQGEITAKVSYPVIRQLYFDREYPDAGRQLLQTALHALDGGRVYAFFHYFGMSCFARHGKLFEAYPWIEAALIENGFVVEHENVYYALEPLQASDSDVQLCAHQRTEGGQQSFDFVRNGSCIGECELHDLQNGAAYLRWICVREEMQNQGLGTRCMDSLKAMLLQNGFHRLDTDTALSNGRAQHFYEKNGFARAGITRSYYRE